jgi:hypothetical protein
MKEKLPDSLEHLLERYIKKYHKLIGKEIKNIANGTCFCFVKLGKSASFTSYASIFLILDIKNF